MSTDDPFVITIPVEDPRHLALRPIAWEHTSACACVECRLATIKRAATRARTTANATPRPAEMT